MNNKRIFKKRDLVDFPKMDKKLLLIVYPDTPEGPYLVDDVTLFEGSGSQLLHLKDKDGDIIVDIYGFPVDFVSEHLELV